MPELTIRNIDPEILARLVVRANEHQRSVEEEHRAILHEALLKCEDLEFQPSFATFLASIPNVGTDTDFASTLPTILRPNPPREC